jgi:hypothetical protein
VLFLLRALLLLLPPLTAAQLVRLQATVETPNVARGGIVAIPLRLTNCSPSPYRYSEMSCSWADNWHSTSPYLTLAVTSPRARWLPTCPTNGLTGEQLAPVEAVDKLLLLYVHPKAPIGKLQFALTYSGQPHLKSDPLTVNILDRQLSLSTQPVYRHGFARKACAAEQIEQYRAVLKKKAGDPWAKFCWEAEKKQLPQLASETYDTALMLESMTRFDEAAVFFDRVRRFASPSDPIARRAEARRQTVFGRPNRIDPVTGFCK